MNNPKVSKALHQNSASLVFSPNWKITLFFIAMLPLLVWLGCWQLERASQKQEMLDARIKASQQLATNITSVKENQRQSFLPVIAHGHYLPGKHILLDNQIMNGRAGYYVYSAFQLEGENASVILVNRGWLMAPSDRRQVPTIQDVMALKEVSGYLWRPSKPGFVLSEYLNTEQWPKIIQSVNFDNIQGILKQEVYPWTLVLKTNDNSEYPAAKYKIAISPEKHTGYAVQWFCMALVLLGMYLYNSFKREVVR